MPTLSARRAYKKSRSPNGTHWPPASTCPWKGDDIPNQRTVAANWDAIKEAVNGLTAAEVAAGAVVWVKPGVLVGYGAASGDVAAVDTIGKSEWTRSVLIYPLNGYGTVTSSTGMRIHNASRIALFGIKSSAAIVWTSFDHVQLGWSKYIQGPNMNTSGKYYEFWEIVNGDVRSNEDVSAVRPSGTNTIRYGKHVGCLFQPAIKAAGSDAHLDTHQSERTGTGGQFGDFEFEDSTYYSSSNGAFITSNTNGMTWRNCSIIALEIWQRVYPLQTGDYKTPADKSKPNAINGGATNVKLYDTDVIGSIGSVNYTHLENARVHYPIAASQQASDGTKWIIAPEMQDWTREYMLSLAPLPTDAYLASIWGDGGTETPGGPEEPADSVKPVVTGFTYPANGATLQPGTDTVKVAATDNVKVQSVALTSGSISVGSMVKGAGAEWALPINTAGFPNGTYPLTARAFDGVNYSDPVTINVTINNSGTAPVNQKPTSVLTAPSGELARVASTVWRGRATDDQYVALTEFFAVTPTGDVKLADGVSVGGTSYEKTIAGALLPETMTHGYMRSTDTGGLSTNSAKVPMTLAPIVDTTPPPVFTVTAEALTATSIRVRISLPQDPDRTVQWFIGDESVGTASSSVERTFTGLDSAYGKTMRAEVTGPNGQVRRSTNTATTSAGNEDVDGPVDVWGFLTDFRLVPLASRQVRLRFVPSGPGVDAARLFSKAAIDAVVAADGAFTTALYPTLTVSPEVWYTPEISYLEAGQPSAYERLPWKLRVPRAGGRIGDLLLAPAPPGVIAIGIGEPDKPYPLYIDLLTGLGYNEKGRIQ